MRFQNVTEWPNIIQHISDICSNLVLNGFFNSFFKNLALSKVKKVWSCSIFTTSWPTVLWIFLINFSLSKSQSLDSGSICQNVARSADEGWWERIEGYTDRSSTDENSPAREILKRFQTALSGWRGSPDNRSSSPSGCDILIGSANGAQLFSRYIPMQRTPIHPCCLCPGRQLVRNEEKDHLHLNVSVDCEYGIRHQRWSRTQRWASGWLPMDTILRPWGNWCWWSIQWWWWWKDPPPCPTQGRPA